MSETWITRDQFGLLVGMIGAGDARERLAAMGINVEEDPTVGADELSDVSIYRLAHAHGYYIGADVSVRDVMRCHPWWPRDIADEVAEQAGEYLGDNDNVGESRSYAIDGAVSTALDYHGNEPRYACLRWNPDEADEPFTDTEGRTWTVVDHPDNSGWLCIACSDGRLLEESGSEWEEIKPEPATAEPAEENVDV